MIVQRCIFFTPTICLNDQIEIHHILFSILTQLHLWEGRDGSSSTTTARSFHHLNRVCFPGFLTMSFVVVRRSLWCCFWIREDFKKYDRAVEREFLTNICPKAVFPPFYYQPEKGENDNMSDTLTTFSLSEVKTSAQLICDEGNLESVWRQKTAILRPSQWMEARLSGVFSQLTPDEGFWCSLVLLRWE